MNLCNFTFQSYFSNTECKIEQTEEEKEEDDNDERSLLLSPKNDYRGSLTNYQWHSRLQSQVNHTLSVV